ncbi:MAG: hypothetical protein LIO78_08615 [Clostridiales bacterium]|nr:hypothetical protein [Clostridiales bacterium]
MFNLIEKGRQHRFKATAIHMSVFLLLYLIYLLSDVITGIHGTFYPMEWAVGIKLIYLWVPVLILRLLNCNIVAGCITGGFLLDTLLAIPLTELLHARWLAQRAEDDYTEPMISLAIWLLLIVLFIIAGIVLECLYRDWKWKHPPAGEGDAST